MDQETREMLEELLDLTKENNRMLAKERRSKKLESLRGILRVVVILIVIIIAYSFLRPYIQGAKEVYNNVNDQIENINDTAQSLNDAKDKLDSAQESVTGFFGGFSDEINDLFGNEGISSEQDN